MNYGSKDLTFQTGKGTKFKDSDLKDELLKIAEAQNLLKRAQNCLNPQNNELSNLPKIINEFSEFHFKSL